MLETIAKHQKMSNFFLTDLIQFSAILAHYAEHLTPVNTNKIMT